jgi:predicted dehydrogenase
MPSSRRLKLALIGAGAMANRHHYPSLAERPEVELAAICDLVPEKRRATAERFHIPLQFADYREMLDHVKPDAVYCLMPPQNLFDLAADVLKRKLNLFVEKPLALNAFQASELALHAERNGCLTMCAYNRRFAPLVRRAREELDRAGGVQLCRAHFHKHNTALYYNGAIDVLSCDAVHVVDLLRFMGGEVKALESAVSRFPIAEDADHINSWIAVLRFESGAVGELSVHWAAAARRLYFEMHNPLVSALSELEVSLVLHRHGQKGPETLLAADLAGSTDPRITWGYKQENDHFIDCLLAGRLPQTHFGDAARTAALVERIWKGTL